MNVNSQRHNCRLTSAIAIVIAPSHTPTRGTVVVARGGTTWRMSMSAAQTLRAAPGTRAVRKIENAAISELVNSPLALTGSGRSNEPMFARRKP